MILHIDMDAFFASVEQRDRPDLKNRPVIVSGQSRRSVVSTASYEARKFGIRSAMPVFMAKKLCPDLVIVPGNMKKYKNDSEKIMVILSKFSPYVEQASIDEAYVDLQGMNRLFGSARQIAMEIKKHIYAQLSLTCSIGIAPVKFLAKIASDMKKPDGLTIIEKDQVIPFINSLPIHKIPGVGKQAMQQMEQLKIKTLGDIRPCPLSILTAKLGKAGARLLELSNGFDHSTVDIFHERKSISSETTFEEDMIDFDDIKRALLDRSQIVGSQLRKKGLMCKNISIKIKFSDFSQITRAKKLDTPICSSAAIFNEAVSLLKKLILTKKIRLAGVGVSSLQDKNTPSQISLWSDEDKSGKSWESVDSAVDCISEKFGQGIIKKASLN